MIYGPLDDGGMTNQHDKDKSGRVAIVILSVAQTD